MKSILFAAILMSGSLASAGASDLYACDNGGIGVDVGVLNGSRYSVMVTSGEGSVRSFTASVEENRSHLEGNSIFALSEKVDSHGVLGMGVLLTINGDKSLIAIDGTVQVLNCRSLK